MNIDISYVSILAFSLLSSKIIEQNVSIQHRWAPRVMVFAIIYHSLVSTTAVEKRRRMFPKLDILIEPMVQNPT